MFKPGDKAIVIGAICPQGLRYIGTVVTIIRHWPRMYRRGDGNTTYSVWETDISETSYDPCYGRILCPGFRTQDLKPYYDGQEPATWEECIWQPNPVAVEIQE